MLLCVVVLFAVSLAESDRCYGDVILHDGGHAFRKCEDTQWFRQLGNNITILPFRTESDVIFVSGFYYMGSNETLVKCDTQRCYEVVEWDTNEILPPSRSENRSRYERTTAAIFVDGFYYLEVNGTLMKCDQKDCHRVLEMNSTIVYVFTVPALIYIAIDVARRTNLALRKHRRRPRREPECSDHPLVHSSSADLEQQNRR